MNSAHPTEPVTSKPSDDQLEALREEMRDLMGAVRECARVVVECKSAVIGLSSKLNMVQLAQLAGEAKAISLEMAAESLAKRVGHLENLLTAAE